jgi:hypothetical protein
MRRLVFALAFLAAASTSARDAIPDLKGTWSGKGKSIVFGTNPHHPGSQTPADPPRLRDIEATYIVDGQEGRLNLGSLAVRGRQYPRAVRVGDCERTARRSSGPIWTAIFASPSFRWIA